MIEAVLTSKGQITIPKKIRSMLRLETKDKILFIPTKDEIVIKAIKGNILDLRGITKYKGGEIDFKELRKKFEKDIAGRVVEKMK